MEKARRRIGPRMRGEERGKKTGEGEKQKEREREKYTFARQGAWPIGARWAPRVGGDSSAPTSDVITRGRVRRCSLAPPGPVPSPSVRGSGPFSSLHERETREWPHHGPRRAYAAETVTDQVANFDRRCQFVLPSSWFFFLFLFKYNFWGVRYLLQKASSRSSYLWVIFKFPSSLNPVILKTNASSSCLDNL